MFADQIRKEIMLNIKYFRRMILGYRKVKLSLDLIWLGEIIYILVPYLGNEMSVLSSTRYGSVFRDKSRFWRRASFLTNDPQSFSFSLPLLNRPMHDFIALGASFHFYPAIDPTYAPMHGYLWGPRAGQKRRISICTCALLRDISKFIVHYGNADE